MPLRPVNARLQYSEGPIQGPIYKGDSVPFLRLNRVLGDAPIRASDAIPNLLPGGLDHYAGEMGFLAGEFEAKVEGLVVEWNTHMPLTDMDMLAVAACGHDHPLLRDPLTCTYHQVTIDVRGKPICLRRPNEQYWVATRYESVQNPFRFAGQVSVIFVAAGNMLFQLGGWDRGR